MGADVASVIQTNHASQAGAGLTSISVALPGNTTAGRKVIVAVYKFSATSLSAPTTTGGYTLRNHFNRNSANIYLYDKAATGTTEAFSVAFGTGETGDANVVIAELSGVGAFKTAGAARFGNGTNPATSPAIACAVGDVIIGWLGRQANSGQYQTPASPYLLVAACPTPGSFTRLVVEHGIADATSEQAAFTQYVDLGWAYIGAAAYEASSGPVVVTGSGACTATGRLSGSGVAPILGSGSVAGAASLSGTGVPVAPSSVVQSVKTAGYGPDGVSPNATLNNVAAGNAVLVALSIPYAGTTSPLPAVPGWSVLARNTVRIHNDQWLYLLRSDSTAGGTYTFSATIPSVDTGFYSGVMWEDRDLTGPVRALWVGVTDSVSNTLTTAAIATVSGDRVVSAFTRGGYGGEDTLGYLSGYTPIAIVPDGFAGDTAKRLLVQRHDADAASELASCRNNETFGTWAGGLIAGFEPGPPPPVVVTGSGTCSGSGRLSGNGAIQTVGALVATVALVAAGVGIGTGAGNLRGAGALSGQAPAVLGSGRLVGAGGVAGQGTCVCPGLGGIAGGAAVSGAGVDVIPVAVSIGVGVDLALGAEGGTGALVAGARLSGTGSPVAPASGRLVAGARLAGSGVTVATGSGAITAAARLTGIANLGSTGRLVASARLSGTGTRAVVGTGTVRASGAVRGTGRGIAASSGLLVASGRVVGTGRAVVPTETGTGALGAAGRLAGAGVRIASGAGRIAASGLLAGTGVGVGASTGAVVGRARLSGTGEGWVVVPNYGPTRRLDVVAAGSALDVVPNGSDLEVV